MNTNINKKETIPNECENCQGKTSIGDTMNVGSGIDENAYDKIVDSECPVCQRPVSY
ncbi:MAG: hypothetical protein ACJAV6_000244 [Candidatus Paceibacteria bacterium]|jgi:hypothetical protein